MSEGNRLFDPGFNLAVIADDTSKLYDKVNSRRAQLRNHDRSRLDPTGAILDIETMDHVPKGRFQIRHHVVFDCFFESDGEGPLSVYLNGSRTGEVPEFKRWSYYKMFKGYTLNIADPMYSEHEELNFGWYWGDETHNYREYVADIVEKVAKILGGPEIIMNGSSAGGGPAVYVANLLENAKAVVINPQIKLSLYPNSRKLVSVVGADLDNDPYSRGDMTDLFSPDTPCKTVMIVNIASESDRAQFDHLCSTHGIPMKYGLSRKGNLTIWTYMTPTGMAHGKMDYYPMVYPIRLLAEEGKNRGSDQWYDILSEMWFDHHNLASKISELNGDIPRSKGAVVSDTAVEEAVIPKDGGRWAHKVVVDHVIPDTAYLLTVKEISSASGRDSVTVLVKDVDNGRILSKGTMDAGERNRFVYSGSRTEGKTEIRLYPDTIGKPNPDDVKIVYELFAMGR
ncbi:MAG: hypothetical protein MJZ68_05575 [archaeon]|nr:hypothetical protein [archaeon]